MIALQQQLRGNCEVGGHRTCRTEEERYRCSENPRRYGSLRGDTSSLLFCCDGLGRRAKRGASHGTNIFAPASTPAKSIADLSVFVLVITGIIFVVVFVLLAYSVVKFRGRARDDGREPAQVYGSTQIELAWTIIPILIVVVLFLATARVIHAIQDAPEPAGTVQVTAIGHQYWWEFRYPRLGIVTANELHIPVSDPSHPTPTFLQLLSADTDHSFSVPELAGKTDLIPNHPNRMWMDPQRTGVFLGQCAQYCGIQHAKMLLRVSVDGPRICRLGSRPAEYLQSKTQAQSKVGECLKAMPA